MNSVKNYTPRVLSRPVRHSLRGVNYHVSEWGDRAAPLLVLLHGWGDTGSSFQFLVDQLRTDVFVIAPDWRGFGESRHSCESYWFPDYLADLHELLEIYSADNPVRLVGHSMGGNIGGLYAGIMPERVAAFVSVEGFGLADSDPGDAPTHYRRWIERSRAAPVPSTYASFDQLASRIRERSPGICAERANYVARLWAERGDDGLIRLKADPAHKLPNAVQYRRAEAAACWTAVAAATLLVLGEDSEFHSSATTWLDPDTALSLYKHAHQTVIPGAGHMVHIEQPAALAAAIEDFLRDL
jgi:pimeloyl-ACP methyl ester carboxylesterase